MCSVIDAALPCYPAWMQPEQKIIADWIVRTKERLGWSYAAWAEKAGLGAATTVTRAIKGDYTSVTSVTTLAALAKAAGEPTVLDFLGGEAAQSDQVAVPSVETLESLLAAVLPLARRGGSARSTKVAAAALQRGLELLGDQSASANPQSLGVASRGAVARLRDLLQQ